jgi:hypothetical protein
MDEFNQEQDDLDLSKFDEDFVEAKIEPKKEFGDIPDGRYQVNVEKVELVRAKTSGHPMLKGTLKIIAPRCVGRVLWRNNVMAP